METVLGLFELLFYVLAILSLSAAVTFAVVKIFPTERTSKKPDKPETPSGDGAGGAGRLFRRAKRGEA